jgi:hypothetical protein
VKLNLKVGIFISDNTDLWLTDASYSGFGTDLDVITGKFYDRKYRTYSRLWRVVARAVFFLIE